MTALETSTIQMRGAAARRRKPVGSWLLPTYVTVAFLILLIPIVYTFAFSN